MKAKYHQTQKPLSTGKIFAGIVLAAAYGFVASVLLTPMSGKKTRFRLKHFLDKRPGRMYNGDLFKQDNVLIDKDHLVVATK